MRKITLFVFTALLYSSVVRGQDISRFIVIDQFGYLPGTEKIAVMKDPQVGFDAGSSYTPGTYFSVVNAVTGEKVFRDKITPWSGGKTDESSGDKAWHFDFSVVTTPGKYFILDEENGLRSFEFEISGNPYNEVLKQAMRSFFYQRSGFPKEAAYAGEAWADSASHLGPLQDSHCRSFFDKDNPATEKDVSGGWYDAGDYNKYTNWTANYVAEMMKAYKETPGAWADDYNIPESGNGLPDILDEARWGIDHLMRLQQEDGSVLSIVGESHASPPSAATGPSYYGPPNTSSALNTAAALAIASTVYRSEGMEAYADTLLDRAVRAWDWAEANPGVLFDNNDPAYGSSGLGAGRQEVDDYGRHMARLEAACYLFEASGDVMYRDYFDQNYEEGHLMQWNFAYPFEGLNQEILLYYTGIEDATPEVRDDILSVYRNAMVNGSENLPAWTGGKDPYMAHMDAYTWGSNSVKALQGSMYYNLITYGINSDSLTASEAALSYIHYLHGVNPLDFVYLSNMYDYGAENGVNEFYHSWFANGSALWDRVGESVYGPPPGYLTGGPNPSYDWDGCCPGGCGSEDNNAWCTSESIAPPKGQPDQKSYKDFNTSWPLNSWSVTENSCGYQVNYIRLLSKFVRINTDCAGTPEGTAFFDSCGVCAGGSTGITPCLDPDSCSVQGTEMPGDTMYVEGRHIYTAAGEEVILRGVNEMFVWSSDKTGTTLLPQIARTGANCVRLVWTAGDGSTGDLVDLIGNCIDLKMIAIPECHDATGRWEKLGDCIDFWKDPVLRAGIEAHKQWTMVNIGNEVGDGNVTDQQFTEGYMAAIDSMRGWGYSVPLIIDASQWGQDVDIIFRNWKVILDHDPLKNIGFSVHSYWQDAVNYDRVADEAINDGLPVIIGEGPSTTAVPACVILDFERGLNTAGRNGIGWMSWSWGGVNNGDCPPNFDHTSDGIFGHWETDYAATLMADHPYSLMRTARRPPSFYDNDTVSVSGAYLGPDIKMMFVGDSVYLEPVICPANALNRGYSLELSGETGTASFDPATGLLAGLSAGTASIKVVSHDKDSVSFTREIEVLEVPVTEVRIDPEQAAMDVGDTLYLEVEVLPADATNRDFDFEVTGGSDIIDFDAGSGRVIALAAGNATVTARWTGGDVSGSAAITIADTAAFTTEAIRGDFGVYPNPSTGRLFVKCTGAGPFDLRIYGLGGNLVYKTEIRGDRMLDISRIPPGFYELYLGSDRKASRLKLVRL